MSNGQGQGSGPIFALGLSGQWASQHKWLDLMADWSFHAATGKINDGV